jgi:thiamine-phosphate pyrophosphorylase
LHQHHELIVDFNLKRIHYTEKLRKIGIADSGSDLIKSTSIHEMKDLIHVADFDYTFFSPVFDSLSKPGYKGKAKTGFEVRNGSSKTKVIALGGINSTNVNQLKDMKFDGAGLLGCIWNDPAGALQTFKNIQATANLEYFLETNQND